MKIITLHQPWASFVALGLKSFETRHWATGYYGPSHPVLIHAAKRLMRDDELGIIWHVERLTGKTLNPYDFRYPTGEIVAIANLADCLCMADELPPGAIYRETRIAISEQTELEKAVGLWEPGRFALKLEDVHALRSPIPFKSRQGKLLDAPAEIIAAVRQQLKEVA